MTWDTHDCKLWTVNDVPGKDPRGEVTRVWGVFPRYLSPGKTPQTPVTPLGGLFLESFPGSSLTVRSVHIKRTDSYLFLGFHLTMLAHLAQQTWFVGILQRCRRHRQLWILDLAKTWLVEFVSVHPVNDLGPGWKTVLKIKIEVLVNCTVFGNIL